MNKYYMKIIIFIILILFGAFLFVYGEFDDSPGGQLLGLVIAVSGVISLTFLFFTIDKL